MGGAEENMFIVDECVEGGQKCVKRTTITMCIISYYNLCIRKSNLVQFAAAVAVVPYPVASEFYANPSANKKIKSFCIHTDIEGRILYFLYRDDNIIVKIIFGSA